MKKLVVNNVSIESEPSGVIVGKVENCETKVLLDTGASISIVPIEYVPEYKRTDMSSLISFAGKGSQRLQLGVCDFLLNGKIFF